MSVSYLLCIFCRIHKKYEKKEYVPTVPKMTQGIDTKLVQLTWCFDLIGHLN